MNLRMTKALRLENIFSSKSRSFLGIAFSYIHNFTTPKDPPNPKHKNEFYFSVETDLNAYIEM